MCGPRNAATFPTTQAAIVGLRRYRDHGAPEYPASGTSHPQVRSSSSACGCRGRRCRSPGTESSPVQVRRRHRAAQHGRVIGCSTRNRAGAPHSCWLITCLMPAACKHSRPPWLTPVRTMLPRATARSERESRQLPDSGVTGLLSGLTPRRIRSRSGGRSWTSMTLRTTSDVTGARSRTGPRACR